MAADKELPKSKVFVSIGRTINQGNYNSLKFDFGLGTEIPSVKEEDIKKEFQRVLKMVAAETATLFKKARKKDEDE